jgi:transposase
LPAKIAKDSVAKRWDCSRATVYNILRECEFKMLNVASKENKERNSWRVPASVVERIEQSRMEPLPEAVQTAA